MKVTRGHSCILCQQRKVRCDKSKPCSNCVKAGVECRVVPPQPPRRRKKRVSERDLVERLRQYESLLSQHGIEFDGLGPDVKITDPGTVQDGDELDTEFVRHRDSPVGDDPETISSPGEKPHAPRSVRLPCLSVPPSLSLSSTHIHIHIHTLPLPSPLILFFFFSSSSPVQYYHVPSVLTDMPAFVGSSSGSRSKKRCVSSQCEAPYL